LTYRYTDIQIYRYTDIQIYRYINLQMDKQIDRSVEMDWQIDKQRARVREGGEKGKGGWGGESRNR